MGLGPSVRGCWRSARSWTNW